MKIRLRMALGSMLLAGGILALASFLTFGLFRQSLLAEIERDVARRAAAFTAAAPTAPYDFDVFIAPDIFLQVVDDAGKPVASSGNLADRTLPMPANARQGRVVEVRVQDRPLFLTAQPLQQGGFIVVARSPMTIYSALSELRRLLSLVVAAGLALAGFMSWVFARFSLRPIGRVIDAARSVRESRDLSQRVNEPRHHDEIGALAETFNAMLAELEEAYRNLDQSNQNLRQFLADCSHELRAPLTLILSNLDVVAKVGDGDPVFRKQALSDIRAESDRMARMVTQLLILARADAGAEVGQHAVALDDLVSQTCKQAQKMANGVRFIVTDSQVLDGAVAFGNAEYLRQALLILLDNAFKYTPSTGEVRVEVGVQDGTARIIVSDTGTGIDADDLPRIFERFFRGKNADDVTGTGLGLPIANWVAHQHGGDIEAVSMPGRGSRFSLVLPLA